MTKLTTAQQTMMVKAKHTGLYRTFDLRQKKTALALAKKGLVTVDIRSEGILHRCYWLEVRPA